jgi:hypothetical protein
MRTNLAARAGRWSAHHRRKAILGWLAFVLLAFVVGGAVGQRGLSQVEMGNGGSQRAGRAIEAADFPDYAEEQILVQDRGRIGHDEPATRAAVADVYLDDKAITEKGAPAGSLSTAVLPTGVSNGATATRPPSSSERDAERSASSTAK